MTQKEEGRLIDPIAEFTRLVVPTTSTGGTSPEGQRLGKNWISLFGEGPHAISDMIRSAGPYISRAKLAYGSSLLSDAELLRAMVQDLNAAGIDTYPGGSVLEMALQKDALDPFVSWAKAVGFTAIEVCDGVIPMADELRKRCINRIKSEGFLVHTVVQEVTRKPTVHVCSLQERIERSQMDLAAGADHVHVVFQALARGETPTDIVGPIKREHVLALESAVGLQNLVFEAMTPDDQLYYLRLLGPEVNLGHVSPPDAVLLQAQRQGLGYESFWSRTWQRSHWS